MNYFGKSIFNGDNILDEADKEQSKWINHLILDS